MKKRPEFIWDGKDDMSMVAIQEFLRGRMSPEVGIFFPATSTKFTLTGKRDRERLATVITNIGSKSAF